jgi:ubiquinone/menaquinone biosynthesis C-methylase UbiE
MSVPTLLNVGGFKDNDRVVSENKWLVVDIEPGADVVVNLLKEPLPYADDTVDAIYTSHTLEHLDLHTQPKVMAEFRRVLKPSAPLRVVVPNWDIAIAAYCRGDHQFLRQTRVVADDNVYPPMPLLDLFSWAYSYHFSMGVQESSHREDVHRTPFNEEVLQFFFNQAGFRDVRVTPYGGEGIFAGMDLEQHRCCSVCVEGVK